MPYWSSIYRISQWVSRFFNKIMELRSGQRGSSAPAYSKGTSGALGFSLKLVK